MDRERQIKELNKKVRTSEAVIEKLQIDLGEVAFADENEKKPDSLVFSLLEDVKKIDKDISDENKRIEDILNTVERSDEIEALRKSLNEKIRSLEKDNMSNYETIGRAGYESYKNGELPAERYSDFFNDIVRLKLKTENAESEMLGIENSINDMKLFRKVKAGARTLYLKNLVSGNYRMLRREYKKSGERLCHSELVMNLEAESVDNAMKPVRENLAGLERLELEDQALSSETEKLKGNLEGLGAGENAVKTVNLIEKTVNGFYTERKMKLQEAGELLFLNQKDSLSKSKGAKAVIKDIEKETQSVNDYQNQIERIEAEIEIERQNREIETLNKKINGYEEKIQNYSEEAEQLKKRISEAVEDIKKLEGTSKLGETQND